jgi:prophage antirepressor-like protein
LWVATDVCREPGYVNGRDAIAKDCKKEGVAKCDTLTNCGQQEVTIIDEQNLYRLMGG